MTFDLLNLILVLIVTIGAIVIGYLLCQIFGIRKVKRELKSKRDWNQESKQMYEYRDLNGQFSMVCEEKAVYASSRTVSLSTEYMGVSSFARLELLIRIQIQLWQQRIHITSLVFKMKNWITI